MTLAQCKATLKSLGLNLVLEKDATIGFEFLVEGTEGTVASGYHEGSKAAAANEALRHPAIALMLSRASQVQPSAIPEPRVPCPVCQGAGTCMLCDDNGLVPVVQP